MGKTPLAAMQPSITALTIVPASCVNLAMSSTWWARLNCSSKPRSCCAFTRPSPKFIFSAVVKTRALELITTVLSLELMPLDTCRAASSSSEEIKRSSLPGKGLSPKTISRPFKASVLSG